jgi:hypothetical protein
LYLIKDEDKPELIKILAIEMKIDSIAVKPNSDGEISLARIMDSAKVTV